MTHGDPMYEAYEHLRFPADVRLVRVSVLTGFLFGFMAGIGVMIMVFI